MAESVFFEDLNDDDVSTILISPGCSNKCVFCQQTFSHPGSEDRARILKSQEIDIVKKLAEAKANGKKGISITGCDPFEYTKLVPLVRYIKSLGFQEIRICSHGKISKGNEKMISDLADAGLTRLRIPLYGSTAEIHDSVTQVPGSFQDLMNTMYAAYALRNRIETSIVTLALEQNKHDLLNIVRYGFQFEVKRINLDVSHVYPIVKDHSFCISYKDLSDNIKDLFDYVQKNKLNVFFCDIPYCIFGCDSRNIVMPKNIFEKEKPKGKFEICKRCRLSFKCDGFFLNNVAEWGLGDIKPITD